MKFVTSMATFAAFASAQVSEIHITLDHEAAEDWTEEWVEGYEEIMEGWTQLIGQIVSDRQANGSVDLRDYAEQAGELIEDEVELWQDQMQSYMEYMGENVTVNGEKLGDLCPLFADESSESGSSESSDSEAAADDAADDAAADDAAADDAAVDDAAVVDDAAAADATEVAADEVAGTEALLTLISQSARPGQKKVNVKIPAKFYKQGQLLKANRDKWNLVKEQINAPQPLNFWRDQNAVGTFVGELNTLVKAPLNVTPQTMRYYTCDYEYNNGYYYATDCYYVYPVVDVLEEVGEAISETDAWQWVSGKYYAYEEINDTYEKAVIEQWNEDVDVATAWFEEVTQDVFNYLSESAEIYNDLKQQRNEAWAEQWATDSAEGSDLLAQRLREATERLEEIQEEATNRITDGINQITDSISDALHDAADFLDGGDEEPVTLVNVSVPKNAEQKSQNNHTYAFVASGLIAAAAFALYSKKQEKKELVVDQANLVDEEFERV